MLSLHDGPITVTARHRQSGQWGVRLGQASLHVCRVCFRLAVALLGGVAPLIAQQQESGTQDKDANATKVPEPVSPFADRLSGDWVGRRKALLDAGLNVDVIYRGEPVGNVRGGEHLDATETGELFLGLQLDTGKRTAWKGGRFTFLAARRHGVDVTSKAGLDLLLNAQEIYGAGEVFRLTELSLQQTFAKGHLVIKGGRLGNEIYGSVDCDFTNLSLCGPPAASLIPNFWFISPIGTWMGWVKAGNKLLYTRVGVGEDNRNNSDRAFFISRSGAKGILTNLELGATPRLLGPNRPSLYRIGGFHTTSCDPLLPSATLEQNLTSTPTEPLQQCGQRGSWIEAQQQVTGSSEQDTVSGKITRKAGLEAFFTYFHADSRTNKQLDTLTTGAYFVGIGGRRPKDLIALAFARNRYNPRANIMMLNTNPSAETRQSEWLVESFYSIHTAPGLQFRPGVQYIRCPGGIAARKPILALGLRVDLTF